MRSAMGVVTVATGLLELAVVGGLIAWHGPSEALWRWLGFGALWTVVGGVIILVGRRSAAAARHS